MGVVFEECGFIYYPNYYPILIVSGRLKSKCGRSQHYNYVKLYVYVHVHTKFDMYIINHMDENIHVLDLICLGIVIHKMKPRPSSPAKTT